MVSPHRHPKDLMEMIRDTKEDMDGMRKCLGKCGSPSPEDQTEAGLLRSRVEDQTEAGLLRSRVEEQTEAGLLRSRVEDQTEAGLLRSRVAEQSGLICALKRRSDETRLRCQALQKVNDELQDRVTDGIKQLDLERRKATLLEKRFNQLVHNQQELIVFKDDYKRRNSQLLEENKLLRTENEALFSEKLRENDTLIRQLQQDLHLNEEKHKATGKDFREKEAEWKSKLLKLTSLQQSQEAVLLRRLDDTQNSLRAAEDVCKDLKRQLQEEGAGRVLTETEMRRTIKTLQGEKDNFMNLSIERGKVIQEKQEKVQQLEIKLEEMEKVKARAENRFKQESEAVNVNLKVRSLQCALEEAVKKHEKAKEDFEAFKEHSTYLLAREKELNAKLRKTLS